MVSRFIFVFVISNTSQNLIFFEERSTILAYLLIDPRLTPLRSDPRFGALARRLEGE